jgi:hypothetical protein
MPPRLVLPVIAGGLGESSSTISPVVLRGSIRGPRGIGSFAVAFIIAGGIARRRGS